jgi:hypothetical protein
MVLSGLSVPYNRRMDASEKPPVPFVRLLALPALFVCTFGASTMILMRIVPGPLKELDFMVIGTVSVMIGLLVVFLMVIKSAKSGDLFFKRRDGAAPTLPPRSKGTSMLNLN